MITIRSYNLFQPSAARTSSRFRPNPAINRWAIFNRPRNADSAEPIFWATPLEGDSFNDGNQAATLSSLPRHGRICDPSVLTHKPLRCFGDGATTERPTDRQLGGTDAKCGRHFPN